MLALLSILALAASASAQNATTATATQIAAIKAHFSQAQLVPQFVQTFQPEGVLSVTYGGQEITPGQKLAASAVGSSPSMSILPASNATRFTDTTVYTVIMADADIVGTNSATTPQTRHWLVNSVGISNAGGQGSYPLNFTGSTAITDYAGPGPFEGTGSHRYVFLVYSQPGAFTPPANLSLAGTPLGTMFVQQYVTSTGLGALVAANYIQVENGVATVTVPSTTAVNTATLSVASSSGSASGSASGVGASASSVSRSMTSGASAASNSAAAATSSRSAGQKAEVGGVGMGLIVGAVGVIGAVVGAVVL